MAGVLDTGNPYYNQYARAGEQISSHGEGRTVNIQEGYLQHPAHADGLVDKGDPVAFFDGCGVAMKSALAATDIIPVDTEGIWKLNVENTGLNTFGTITVGQVLFIDAAGRVYDDWQTSYTIFGYALEAIDTVRTDLIAVKVHWQWPFWFYDVPEP
ncbi:MAG: hypothetical protein A2Y91_03445 [Chloroflexi bacterium RBG_13_54_8]|nr:MAG: hypothetical protein A2Y91_03445 [Chloroflexi bacterium RBG_13_54_8]